MRKRKTHFEQIPVAIVKNIARVEESKEKQTGSDVVIVQIPAAKTGPYSAGTGLHCRNGL
jgi:hypothetical protein